MISKNDLIRIIRHHEGCGLIEAQRIFNRFNGASSISKREHFAGLMMSGFLSVGEIYERDEFAPEVARKAVLFADALLKELEKE